MYMTTRAIAIGGNFRREGDELTADEYKAAGPRFAEEMKPAEAKAFRDGLAKKEEAAQEKQGQRIGREFHAAAPAGK